MGYILNSSDITYGMAIIHHFDILFLLSVVKLYVKLRLSNNKKWSKSSSRLLKNLIFRFYTIEN